MFILALLLCLPSMALAQLAIETEPGVTYYDYGRTRSVEITPGVKHFSGEVEGTVTDFAPGIRSYSLHQNHPSGVPLDLYQQSMESNRNFEASAESMRRSSDEITRKTDEWLRQRGRR